MGGHAAGHVASRLAGETFQKYFQDHYSASKPADLLHQSLDKANQAIAQAIEETNALQGMGCTFVAALLEKSKMYWISVGDSHLYLVRNQEIAKKNVDHSYGGLLERLAAEGQTINTEEAYPSSMLLSALTGGIIVEVDSPEAPFVLHAGDRVILATDGLNTLSREKILAASIASATAESFVHTLLNRVVGAQARNQDNTTVVAIDVLERHFAANTNGPLPLKSSYSSPASSQRSAATPARTVSYKSRSRKRGRTFFVILALLILTGGVYFLVKGGISQNAQAPLADIPPSSVLEPTGKERTQDETEANESAFTRLQSFTPFQDQLHSGERAPKMVWIDGGDFQMGSVKAGAERDEQPPHTVWLKRFALSQYEITYGDYAPFALATGHPLPADSDKSSPVVMIPWEKAVQYTRWLSKQTGYKYRLPSEAEWEYAAAAGKTSPFWWGLEAGRNHAHCLGCGTNPPVRIPFPVGRFRPNPFGLYDTAGNVLEWVQDCYHTSYEGAPTNGRAWEDTSCTTRVARGGSFSTAPSALRTTKRNSLRPGQRYDDVGFRVAREP